MKALEVELDQLVYGGAFNPIHRGHTLVVKAIRTAFPYTPLLLTPSRNHPHQKHLVEFKHRLAMCKLALQDAGLANDKLVQVSDIEAQNPTGRTFDLLHLLPVNTGIVISTDNADSFSTWFNYEYLIQNTPFIVLNREINYIPSPKAWYLNPPHTYLKETTPHEVSSTEVRLRLNHQKNIDDLVLPSVVRYIQRNHLYV